jgi:signal transduction histidine kinase
MEKTDLSYKRRTYFIEKKFQSRFIMKFCFLVMLSGGITIGLVYLFSQEATTVAIVNSRVMVRSTADFMLPLLLQTVAIAVVLTGLATVGVTLFVSHRIAGPLYRFKKVAESLEKGDFSRGFVLRTHDELQDVAESMNAMIKANRLQIGGAQELAGILKHNLDKFVDGDVATGKISSLQEMKRVAKELQAVVDKFKT